MEPVLIIPSFGFQRASNHCTSYQGCQPVRCAYRRQWNHSPLDLTSRLFQLLDDDNDCNSLPSLFLHLRKHDDTKESPDCCEGKAADKQGSISKSDKFNVSLKLEQTYSPEELSIKIVGKSLKIEGKHEDRLGEDGEFIARQFTRSYHLPDDVDLEQLTSSLSEEGVLSVEAPRLTKEELEPIERNIPIQHHGETDPVIDDDKRDEEKEEVEAKEDGETREESMEEGEGVMKE